MKVTERPARFSAFREIKSCAQSRWQELWNSGKPVIMVGTATCGRAAGSLEVLQALRDEIKKQNLDCPAIEVGCMGHCYAEPIVIISKPGYPPICYGHVNPVIAERLIREFILGDNPCLEFVLGAMEENDLIPSFLDFPRARYEKKVILKNCGQIDPVLEGTIIAGYAIGARYGYIYVRTEYPLAVHRVQVALGQARKRNLLGKNILGSDFSFDIRLFQGSGAFVCGEETALIASMEGEPGMPHHRPPYPATNGLYEKPTLINNVKTLASIRHIIENGAEWFASTGTASRQCR